MTLKLPIGVYEALRFEAAGQRRSLNAQATLWLEEAARRAGLLPDEPERKPWGDQ